MPPRFCNKQRSALLILEIAPFFLRKSALEVPCPSKFEMLPTSLGERKCSMIEIFKSFETFCNKFKEVS